jgi:hypothetical protein
MTASPTEKQDLAEWLTLWIADCDFEETSSDYAAAKLVRALSEAGYVIVPREPTAEMIEAHIEECAGDAGEAGPDRIRSCWHAMVEAVGR